MSTEFDNNTECPCAVHFNFFFLLSAVLVNSSNQGRTGAAMNIPAPQQNIVLMNT